MVYTPRCQYLVCLGLMFQCILYQGYLGLNEGTIQFLQLWIDFVPSALRPSLCQQAGVGKLLLDHLKCLLLLFYQLESNVFSINLVSSAANVLKSFTTYQKSVKASHITYACGTLPLLDWMYLLLINLCTLCTHNKSQKHKFIGAKGHHFILANNFSFLCTSKIDFKCPI